MHKTDFSVASSEAIESALGQQIEAIRLSRNLTQAQLADQAGISRSTFTRLVQDDKGISLDSFIRIMQALELRDHLQALLPDPGVSPLEELEKAGKKRQRARNKKNQPSLPWTWNDTQESE